MSARTPRGSLRQGFTLVELLVVMTIIAILVSIMIPAAFAALEAARRIQCRNNIRQLALAALNHEHATGYFPSGGWGNYWVGDPDLGTGRRQPGGFFYSILPYMDGDNIYNSGRGGGANATAMCQKVIVTNTCPSRRRATLGRFNSGGTVPRNASAPSDATRGWYHGDYTVNGGSVLNLWYGGPSSITDGQAGTGFQDDKVMTTCTGISYQRSQVAVQDITDGTTNTYLLGEKFMDPSDYYTGTNRRDDDPLLSGSDDDLHSWADGTSKTMPPMQDKSFTGSLAGTVFYGFGSAHSAGFTISLCDGSARIVTFAIDPALHISLASRCDGVAVDLSRL